MGYRIVYGKAFPSEDKKQRSHLRLMTAAFALAFVIGVRCFWPEGAQLLRRALLPGESAVQTAFLEMTEQIRAGEPAGEAVTAFCRAMVADGLGE